MVSKKVMIGCIIVTVLCLALSIATAIIRSFDILSSCLLGVTVVFGIVISITVWKEAVDQKNDAKNLEALSTEKEEPKSDVEVVETESEAVEAQPEVSEEIKEETEVVPEKKTAIKKTTVKKTTTKKTTKKASK